MSNSSLRAQLGPSRRPSMASTTSVAAASGGLPSANVASTPAQRIRRMVWDATIPIVVSVESDQLSQGSIDRSVETHYVKAPRISYLPLLLQELKDSLLSLMMDEQALKAVKEEEYWFTFEGTPLRWHWPIGLLFDYHTANTCPTIHRSTPSPAASQTNLLRKPSIAPLDNGQIGSSSTADNSSAAHMTSPPLPWRLTLRIGSAPLDKLHSAPGLDNCRTAFMSMLKEADFVRWGSTKRVTNLRKTEQDALWEGVLSHNFDTYWSVASKLIPPVPQAENVTVSTHPSRAPSLSTPGSLGGEVTRTSLMGQFGESQTSLHSAAASESGASVAESNTPTRNGNNQYRSLPMRFHLVQGAPVVQEPVAPYLEDGRPTTLHSVLSALFPLLFPPTPTFSTSALQTAPPPLAYAVIQGIRMPLDAEIPWIGAALPSADGWIPVCLHLLSEGEKA